eukprot:snap_masked-scaffold_11-processed-gene-8.33-mRNA-1 protein AED:0.11 eAED:0.11 QI:0/-1/0/1/-1/1/1/0/261
MRIFEVAGIMTSFSIVSAAEVKSLRNLQERTFTETIETCDWYASDPPYGFTYVSNDDRTFYFDIDNVRYPCGSRILITDSTPSTFQGFVEGDFEGEDAGLQWLVQTTYGFDIDANECAKNYVYSDPWGEETEYPEIFFSTPTSGGEDGVHHAALALYWGNTKEIQRLNCAVEFVFDSEDTLPPAEAPTHYPSPYPTAYPIAEPTSYPSNYPSPYPTFYPSAEPTGYPSNYPSPYPTEYPSQPPLITAAPSIAVTPNPCDHC